MLDASELLTTPQGFYLNHSMQSSASNVLAILAIRPLILFKLYL